MTRLSGWGRFPVAACKTRRARSEADVAAALDTPLIARGNGRAYGDAALNPDLTLDMRGTDRMISFDAGTGVLVAEAGVLLADIIAAFLPRGWFPMVTPGTKFVTLGGAIAADVHGKNHHRDGSFRRCLDWIEVMGPEGEVTRTRPGDDLFDWTCGGMGLTGVILRAQLRLAPVATGWIEQEVRAAPNLDAAMDEMEMTLDRPYSVAWVDCLASGRDLGRSLIMLGRHADLSDLPAGKRAAPFATPDKTTRRLPFDLPPALLNSATLGTLNAAYYARGRRKTGKHLVDWDSYFYPLDTILDWNRGYGKRGFVQFQCVLPMETAREGMRALLKRISASGQGSFLSVLKRMGPAEGRFSFPMEGYTLALDFPATERALDLMKRLDDIMTAFGGRQYLAKDARMEKRVLDASDPRAKAFAEMRAQQGLTGRFTSLQSERLGL